MKCQDPDVAALSVEYDVLYGVGQSWRTHHGCTLFYYTVMDEMQSHICMDVGELEEDCYPLRLMT